MAGPGGGGHFGRGYLTEEEKKNAPKVTPELLKRVFSYLKPYWKQMLLVICAIFVSSVFTLLPSVLTGRIIDEGLIGRDMAALIRAGADIVTDTNMALAGINKKELKHHGKRNC